MKLPHLSLELKRVATGLDTYVNIARAAHASCAAKTLTMAIYAKGRIFLPFL